MNVNHVQLCKHVFLSQKKKINSIHSEAYSGIIDFQLFFHILEPSFSSSVYYSSYMLMEDIV